MDRRILFAHGSKILLGSVLILALQSCSILLPRIAPFSDLPAPTGPYLVGTRSTTWVDSSREETFTPESDYRKIVVQVWYPQTGPAHIQRYIAEPEQRIPALAKQLRLPVSTIQHVDRVMSNATLNATPAMADSPFPVIIFSHGLSGMRYQNSALMEDLASHGYIIFAPDHSYDANISIFSDGQIAEYRAGKRRPLTDDYMKHIDMAQLGYRVGDLKFILDRMAQPGQEPFWDGLNLDLERIGLLGHSLGGTTVLTTQHEDLRIRATLVLDGWYTPLPENILAAGSANPLLNLGQKQWPDPKNYDRMYEFLRNTTTPHFNIFVPNTVHTDFTDMPIFSPFSRLIGYTRSPNPEALLSLIRETNRIFFDTYLKQKPIPDIEKYIHALSGVSTYSYIP